MRWFKYIFSKRRIISLLKVVVSAVDLVLQHLDNDTDNRTFNILTRLSKVAESILGRFGVPAEEAHMDAEETCKCLDEVED